MIRFAKRVMNSDITIIGSAGCTHELFDHSAARQTDTAYPVALDLTIQGNKKRHRFGDADVQDKESPLRCSIDNWFANLQYDKS